VGIGSTQHAISNDFGLDNLTSDISISDTDDKSPFRCIVFSFILLDEMTTLPIIGPVFSSSSHFGAVPLVILAVLHQFDETHGVCLFPTLERFDCRSKAAQRR